VQRRHGGTFGPLKGQRHSLFRGEMLRGLLLTSYAWAMMGLIAGLAAWVAFGAAAVMVAFRVRLAGGPDLNASDAPPPGPAHGRAEGPWSAVRAWRMLSGSRAKGRLMQTLPVRPARASEPTTTHRLRFHQSLARLEAQVQAMAIMAERALRDAVDAAVRADVSACDAVVAGDEAIDIVYEDVERQTIGLMAREQPVASELRLLVGLLHVGLHLERIGDLAVDVAAATRALLELNARSEVAPAVQELGAAASEMTDAAVAAFVARDARMCEAVAARGRELHAFDRALLDRALHAGDDPDRLRWAVDMLQIGRHLARAAEHAIDIAEQGWFLVTGELRELA
jgi:phosphate transport system protein